jgi:hypothetical protein
MKSPNPPNVATYDSMTMTKQTGGGCITLYFFTPKIEPFEVDE